ncbi:hypothetical protein PR202_ga30206 [Eleusine coracana subsp. coracana]|uniref:Uncharacterized protein n=1 Tax=Eleusine coracana subsp. coracana TaxID=191504 RepID=A0AAV5DP33_ELECO|nr:hypothetical protein PR202_ga30206 [Eleusine coracana subsp. coracana]
MYKRSTRRWAFRLLLLPNPNTQEPSFPRRSISRTPHPIPRRRWLAGVAPPLRVRRRLRRSSPPPARKRRRGRHAPPQSQMPPQAQDPQPHTPVAAAEDAGNGKESHPDAEAHPFHSPMHSPAKPAAAADQLESAADEEELEVVPKKAATTSKSKAEVHEKKRPAPEPAAPSGKAKKAKAEASKGEKMGITKMEKVVPQPTLSRKGDKPTGGNPAEKSGLSSSGLTKSEARRPWSKKDPIMILEALAAHVKSDTALMKTADLLALVRDRLDRKLRV